MKENIAFSLALDLLFNGQNMDYCERPFDLSIFDTMAMFENFPERATVAVVGPGGGRLVKALLSYGCNVDAYESRYECRDHLTALFRSYDTVRIYSGHRLNEPTRRDKMSYHAIFCMDDLRSFRENQEWTENVQKIIRPGGFLVYSQVSNILPKKKNTLANYFDIVGDYNVSDETAKMIRDSYLSVENWEPEMNEKDMAIETLNMIKSASTLRRNIMSGVEVRYIVWQRKGLGDLVKP